jgi:endonuclease YncB( thermonuclease family)
MRSVRFSVSWTLAAFLALVLGFAAPKVASAPAADIIGAATVRGDGALRIGNRTVRLYGIYIPPTRKTCIFFLQPARCGGRAALALETKIQGFVFCYSINQNADRSVNAICFVRRTFYSEGEDLAAFLVAEGLALTLPGGPFEYLALERIAQTRQLGVWGFSVDAITPR